MFLRHGEPPRAARHRSRRALSGARGCAFPERRTAGAEASPSLVAVDYPGAHLRAAGDGDEDLAGAEGAVPPQ